MELVWQNTTVWAVPLFLSTAGIGGWLPVPEWFHCYLCHDSEALLRIAVTSASINWNHKLEPVSYIIIKVTYPELWALNTLRFLSLQSHPLQWFPTETSISTVHCNEFTVNHCTVNVPIVLLLHYKKKVLPLIPEQIVCGNQMLAFTITQYHSYTCIEILPWTPRPTPGFSCRTWSGILPG